MKPIALLLVLGLLLPMVCFGGNAPPAKCAIIYTVVRADDLGNVAQGASKKNAKWLETKMQKKYPDVCYVGPEERPSTILFITAKGGSVYHGTRVVPETTYGSAYGYGNATGSSYSRTSTTYKTVPQSFEYDKTYLVVETFGGDGKPIVRHRFEQNGVYHIATALWSKGRHPRKAVLEEAIKWIHDGGLNDPLQAVR